MGMAAGQARLLTITARINDIGYELMSLSATKMALASEADILALNHNEALNEKRLKWSNDAGATMYDLTYDTLMQPSQLNAYEPYMITDMAGKVVVDDKYQKYAQMISPTGAPGGNYEAHRDQILAELLGVSAEDFAAENKFNEELNAAREELNKHLANEPELVKTSASSALSSLGAVTGDAITANEGAMGDNAAVTRGTTWGDIVNSIRSQTNYVTYLHYNKDKTKSADQMNAELKNIINQFGAQLTNGLGEFSFPQEEIQAAADKTYALFTSKYEFEGNDHSKKEMANAGANAHTVNTISHWHDNGTWFDGSGDAYAVSLTNMANVFLGYLLDPQNAEEKIKANNAGTYTIDLNKISLTTPASQAKHDEWEAKKAELEAAVTGIEEEFVNPFDEDTERQMDFYDAIFNAIATNGWTYNENISNTEYLNDVLQTGLYNITQADKSVNGWEYDESSPTTCQNIFQVSDQNAINRADQEYEREKTRLHKKETAIDVEMKNLETEQSALNEMRESIRNQIDENVERTFKTFG